MLVKLLHRKYRRGGRVARLYITMVISGMLGFCQKNIVSHGNLITLIYGNLITLYRRRGGRVVKALDC